MDEYTDCEIKKLSHPTLAVGDACPDCAALRTKGRLCADEPKVVVKLMGGPLISGTKYQAECLRCSTCQTRFTTHWPDEIKNQPKYDVSCGSTLAVGRYGMGLPMNRIETHQASCGIPLPDATQWDLLQAVYQKVLPVHEALIEQGSDANLIVYDDTPGRILSEQARGRATHTTAFVAVNNRHNIHLFLTGENHSGNNVSQILDKRTSEESVIAMMDASANNQPKKMTKSLAAKFILCFCLTHGRRKFFEIFHNFEKQCEFVLKIIGQVYQHDKKAKQLKMSDEERLSYHQQYSQPLMQSLYQWLNNQLLYDEAEPHSGLGQAIQYLLRHWKPLTTFLRVAGAPLDSSWAERTIKIAIRHRRNSLFYATPNGAQVGDCLMSLIHTAQQNQVNPLDYLNALQRHAEAVKNNPHQWLPWNYQQAA